MQKSHEKIFINSGVMLSSNIIDGLLSEYESVIKRLNSYIINKDLTIRQKHLTFNENKMIIDHERKKITEGSSQLEIDSFLDLMNELEEWNNLHHPKCCEECYELSDFEKLIREGYTPAEARKILYKQPHQ